MPRQLKLYIIGVVAAGALALAVTTLVIPIDPRIGAGFALDAEQKPSWRVFSTSSVRVGDPGGNLVGPGWTGDSAAPAGDVPS